MKTRKHFITIVQVGESSLSWSKITKLLRYYARIRVGCSKLKLHLYIIIYMLLRRNHANVVTGARIYSISFSNALVMLPCETIFS